MSVHAKKPREEIGGFDATACAPVSLAGADLLAHSCGVLFWPDEETLIVADLHFEKGSSFATKQIFLPPYDTRVTLDLLGQAVDGFQPKRLIALGDSFHDQAGPDRLNSEDAHVLSRLVERLDWYWVAGNHDPALPARLGGHFMDDIRIGPLTFRHQPAENAAPGEVSGHLHPCARVRRRGRSVRRRCFVVSSKRVILPSFGAFTGGLNVRNSAFDVLFPDGQHYAYMMGTGKLFPVAPASCLLG